MTLRAALIGCGRIACEWADDPRAAAAGIATHAHAYAVCPDTELVAVCDCDPGKAARCADRWHIAARYSSPRQLLAEQRPHIVSICTPDSTHYELVRAALETDGVRGILAEKPLAQSIGEAAELVDLARRRGVVLAVNYSRRYTDNHRNLRRLVRSGSLGKVRLIRGLYTKGTLHNGTHWFDLLRFLIGEVRTVTAVDRLGEPGDDPTLDVRLDCHGVQAELFACSAQDFAIFELDLLGTRGRVRMTETGQTMELFEPVEGVPYAGYRSLVLKQRTTDGLRDMLLHAVQDLARCVQTGERPACTGEDGLKALRIALMARESALKAAPTHLEGR
jgi:predicted dehydrogenase